MPSVGIPIQTVKKFFYLRQIAEGAKKTASTLRDAIMATAGAVYSPTFQKGRLVVSQSGSGQSGSFQMAGSGNEWTQDNIAGMLEEFVQQLDLTASQGTPDSVDPDLIDTLLAKMMDDINIGNVPVIGINQQMGDFSMLNVPASSIP